MLCFVYALIHLINPNLREVEIADVVVCVLDSGPLSATTACRIWNLNNGTCKHVLEGHTGRLNCVVVSDDGQVAVSGSDDGTARVWDTCDGTCKKVLQASTFVGCSIGAVVWSQEYHARPFLT